MNAPLLTPPFVVAQLLTLVTAILALVTAFGHGLSVDQETAILGLAGGVIGLVQMGWMIHHGLTTQVVAAIAAPPVVPPVAGRVP